MSYIETSLSRGSFEERSIVQTAKRKAIERLMDEAMEKSRHLWRGYERANAVYDKIPLLGGIAILERRNPSCDYRHGYSCFVYVFGTVQREAWGNIRPWDLPSDFGMRAKEFLEDKGYKIVDEPEDGDVIAYGCKINDGYTQELFIRHFGVYRSEPVVSKFGPGPVFRHEIDAVPNDYGEEVIFFRKKT